jgi:hypothetical protein
VVVLLEAAVADAVLWDMAVFESTDVKRKKKKFGPGY